MRLVATTCSWLLESQSFCLTRGLFQNLSHGATGHRATVVPSTRMWLMQGRLQVGLGKGILVWVQHRILQCPSQKPTRIRRKYLALRRIMQIICLYPDFENTQMLVYKSESCLGAISVPSLILTVFSVNTRDQGFTVSLLSGSP